MANPETWYDRQATISKLLLYLAILILLASLITSAILAFVFRAHFEAPDLNLPTIMEIGGIAMGGVFVASVMAAFSAIIDLLIVNAEALRSQGKR